MYLMYFNTLNAPATNYFAAGGRFNEIQQNSTQFMQKPSNCVVIFDQNRQ